MGLLCGILYDCYPTFGEVLVLALQYGAPMLALLGGAYLLRDTHDHGMYALSVCALIVQAYIIRVTPLASLFFLVLFTPPSLVTGLWLPLLQKLWSFFAAQTSPAQRPLERAEPLLEKTT